MRVELLGRNSVDGQNRLRCNAEGIGVWAVAQAGELWSGQENTTLYAGLGQSRQPLLFGIAGIPASTYCVCAGPMAPCRPNQTVNDH